MVSEPTIIGVLALQGSFAEHIASVNSLATSYNVHAIPIRTPAELSRCRGLIIPGGESTAISLIINKSGLYEPLKEFVRSAKAGEGKSIWGTCAGMILLAKEIEGPTSEGWEGLEGIDVRVGRNSYGRQLQSFSHPLQLSFLPADSAPLLATFIRAPLLDRILEPSPSSPPLEILARIPKELVPTPQRAQAATGGEARVGEDSDVVMYKQGGLVASSWHPELNRDDSRVHEWWVKEVVLGTSTGSTRKA
ncbi:putative pyridoxal 5'-phosphate synthase [Sporobolomyces salmoneus]|uniref:putative pyridoxal 5'-phosphate synthase n=1 Tax=Sporobolomyces salmoneus TaxID=183962 RepID=UPI00317025B4